METDLQNTFQPTENRYPGLGREEFQSEKPDVTGKCLPLLPDKLAGRIAQKKRKPGKS